MKKLLCLLLTCCAAEAASTYYPVQYDSATFRVKSPTNIIFQGRIESQTNALAVSVVTNRMGIGMAPVAYSSLTVDNTDVVTDESSAIQILRTMGLTQNLTNWYFGLDGGVHVTLNGYSISDVRAFYGGIAISGSGTAGIINPLRAYASATGSDAVITNYNAIYSSYSGPNTGTGHTKTATGFWPVWSSGNFTTIRDIYIPNEVLSTNHYGIYSDLNADPGSFVRYNIYFAGSASNYFGGAIKSDGNIMAHGGSGTNPGIGWTDDDDGTGTGLFRPAANQISFMLNGTQTYKMTSAGLLAVSDNTVDLGANGATRFRNAYIGTDVVAGGDITAGASAKFALSGRLRIEASADGIVNIRNTGATAFADIKHILTLPRLVVSVPHTVVTTNCFLQVPSTGTVTLGLASSFREGRVVIIKSGSSVTTTVARSGSDTIDGASADDSLGSLVVGRYMSDGTNNWVKW